VRTALVTDASRGSAIAVIRSLARTGWRVIAADSERTAPGRFSRDTADWVRYPDPRRAPQAAVEALLAAVTDRHVDLVFPVTDDVILPLLERRSAIERSAMVALPSTELLRTAADKAAILELAGRCGVPAPRTRHWCPGSGADLEADPGLGWPVVVKPVRSRTVGPDGRGVAHEVAYADDPAQLASRLRTIDGPVLLQERVGGVGQGLEVVARDGDILAAFQHRRLREYPPSGGASSFREAVDVDPQLLDDATRLLSELRWTGLAMVEFKSGASGHHLMEINGRVWGSLPLAVAAGVDFPALAAAVHLGDPLPVVGRSRPGTRSRNVELELKWAAAVVARRRLGAAANDLRRRDATRVLTRLFTRPSDGYDVLELRDPIPGVVDAARAVVSTVRGAVG
jgi:predicted ATP-grasp superfamily ATP-dependent carboligase